tara:strand:- start:35 stop:208 length:174 start_codon:yes stop_codon:yes gene_type:complete
MEDSKNKIDMIGEISLLPGLINQKEPKIPKINGMKKNFINLFLFILINKKQIKLKVK